MKDMELKEWLVDNEVTYMETFMSDGVKTCRLHHPHEDPILVPFEDILLLVLFQREDSVLEIRPSVAEEVKEHRASHIERDRIKHMESEYAALDKNRVKLAVFMGTAEYETLPREGQWLILRQELVMAEYSVVLLERMEDARGILRQWGRR